MAVAHQAHGETHADALVGLLKGDRRVMTTLVGEVGDVRRSALHQRRLEHVEREFGAQRWSHSPADDALT
jgi:hypothetical protein